MAQEKGYVSASLESTNHIYVEDKENGFIPSSQAQLGEDGIYASNNYLKVDYYKGRFSAGTQLEGYFPYLVGYPSNLKKMALSNLYANWRDDSYSVTVGTFYDQFGSGLLFRSWEDRTLGMNNALMGARFTYNYEDIVGVKAIWGMPRFGMEFSDTQVRGIDLQFSLSNLLKWQNTTLSIEGSYLNRYEKLNADLEEIGAKPYSNGYSGRLHFGYKGFSLKGEVVDGGEKHYLNPRFGQNDDMRSYLRKYGNAQLVELSYNGHGLGINLAGRRLEWMNSPILQDNTSTSNLLNYIPAMSAQYTYLLMNLHPYSPQLGDAKIMNSGEIGGQADIYYNFKRGSALGGKRGMKIHANFSTYYTLHEENTAKSGNMLYRNINVDLEKQFSRKFKMYLLWAYQEYNPSYGENKTTHLANIFVADLTYKWTPDFSTRLELQYLTTYEDQKDWMAALLEVNFAPHWSIYGSDMYNHGDTKTHYYNAGVSYTKSRTRIALSYGRNKAGYVCSGGVCRTMPAYTGGNLAITIAF
jgi:hypothetical protein